MMLSELRKLGSVLRVAEVRRVAGSSSSRVYRRFTPEDEAWLRENAGIITANEAATHLKSSPNTIRHKVKAMGITLKYQRKFK